MTLLAEQQSETIYNDSTEFDIVRWNIHLKHKMPPSPRNLAVRYNLQSIVDMDLDHELTALSANTQEFMRRTTSTACHTRRTSVGCMILNIAWSPHSEIKRYYFVADNINQWAAQNSPALHRSSRNQTTASLLMRRENSAKMGITYSSDLKPHFASWILSTTKLPLQTPLNWINHNHTINYSRLRKICPENLLWRK